MNKCPQCGELFEEEDDLKDHLRDATREPEENHPRWPEHQIEYYATQGLFKEEES